MREHQEKTLHPVPPAMAHHLASVRVIELRSTARPGRLGAPGPGGRRPGGPSLRLRRRLGWALVDIGLRLAVARPGTGTAHWRSAVTSGPVTAEAQP